MAFVLVVCTFITVMRCNKTKWMWFLYKCRIIGGAQIIDQNSPAMPVYHLIRACINIDIVISIKLYK